MTEQELIAKAKQGDESAFADLLAQNQSKIFTLTLRMTGNRQDAEDLAQEAFLNAWRGLKNFQGDSSFSTWMYRLASNACIDHIRAQKRRHEVLDTTALENEDGETIHLPDSRFDPQQQLERQEIRHAVAQGLSTISEDHRRILVMRELSGMSYQEIGDILTLDAGTVKSRIARARGAMRKILLEQGNFFSNPSSTKSEDKMRGGSKNDTKL